MKVCDKRNHEIHQIHKSGVLKSLFSWFIMICAAFSSYAGVVEATSPVFGFSLKHDGVRQSAGVETLTYSSQWDGGEGATVTIAENGRVLAEGVSGEGTRAWSVQKTGEYMLTHTTYTNGIAGKVETAKFVVPGPELTFEYDGGPFVGGKVTINGNIDGWTIYYTLDGSTPTTESLKYTGPFTLSSAVNLKAYAVSDSGIETVCFDKDYSDVQIAYAEGIIATQRQYPDNNLVDIEFTVVGSADKTYAISFFATNSIDGAYIPMKTIWQDGVSLTNIQFFVTPGKYHFVWDAKTDAPLLASVSTLTIGVSCCLGEKYMSIDLQGGVDAENYPIKYIKEQPQGGWNYANKTTNLVLRLIAPGTFTAQCEDSSYNSGYNIWSDPVKITITKPFYIGVFEVTQDQFARVTGRWPSYFQSSDRHARPVESINWGPDEYSRWDIIRGSIDEYVWPTTYNVSPSSFMGKLRKNTRLNFDLPTEAQWEYACRAGTTSEYYKVGVTKDTFAKAGLARYVGNSGSYSQEIHSGGSWENATQGTAIVGSYKSNDWGLYDMLGNVNEWVLDRLRAGVDPEYAVTGSYRILRGGSWRLDEYACSCRFRTSALTTGQTAKSYDVGYKSAGVGNGFRIVCPVSSTLIFADSTIIGSDIPFAADDVTIAGFTGKYDGAAHGVGVTVNESIEDVTLRYATGPLGAANPASEWSEEAPTLTDVGSMTVWCEISAPGYIAQTNSATLAISPRPVTVNVVGHSGGFAYDTTAKSVSGYEATTEDELYDIAADTVFGGSAAVSRIDVGTTAMGLAAGQFSNGNANFDVTYLVTDGGITVTPRIIGDDPANWDIRLDRAAMYDGTLKAAPIIQVAFRKPDGNLVNIPHVLEGNTATDAGNYKVRIAGTGNYSGSVEMDWAITPRNVVFTSGTAAWTYDGAAHSETGVSVTGDGFVAGEGAAYSAFPVVTHIADASSPIANTFSYALNPGTKAGNYAITVKNGTVQMLPRAITLTAPTKEKNYDGEALTFTAAEVEVSGEGYAPGESFTLGGFASITEAGRTDATFTVADGTAKLADYVLTQVAGSLTVKKNATEITVTAKSGSWVYDGTAHTLHEYEATNLGVLLAGDELEVVFSDASTVTTPVDGELQDGVVKNAIASLRVLRNGTEDVTANYTLAPYEGTIAVVKRPVTLTSKSAEKVYDGEPLTAHEVEVGGDGFVSEDGANYVFTGTQTEKGKSANSFTYTLKSGTNAAYYEVTKVEGDLEVTAADIGESVEGDWTIVLGPALAYTGLEQIQTLSSVMFKNLQLDYSVIGNAQTDAGTYRMTLTGQGNFTGTHEVEWSIAPKALSLTAGSGSRVYDGTAFTVAAVTAEGFVAGEGAEYVCDGSQKDVGSSANNVSAINWNANTKGSNYAVTKVPGTLTVTPRLVTLTAANISKPYDGTPLALTVADITAEGLVAGESLVYSGFASRTEAGQTPATFEFAAGANMSLANYSITVTPGRTITITKSATAISVTAASESWVYDGEAHSNRTWTATNLSTLQPGDELEVSFDGACVVTTPQDGPANDGIVPNVITGVRVIRNGAEDVTANYTVEWFPGTLTVTKRPVTVTVKGATATHVYDAEEKSVSGYEISTADELYDIAADTAFSGADEAKRTDAGKTEMGLSASDFTNGNECFDVTYDVTDGWVEIDPADITGGEEGDFAIVLGANPKYNGTVQTIPVESVAYKGLPVTYTLTGENATHAGTYTLTVKANGNFTGEMSTTWQVLKRVVTLTSASASRVYDGTPLTAPAVTVGGDGFIGLEGATFDVTGSQTVAGSSKNAFAYTLKAGTLASDYDITKIEGDLTVAKAKYPGQEPGGAGISWNVAADAATWMYDGKTHGVALVGVPAGVTVHLTGDTAKDAGEYTASATFDYDSANYETPVFPAPLKWTIAKRPISLKTVNAEKPYDGFPLSVEVANITPGMSGYADGECFEYFDLASITEVGETPATFSYRDSATAKVANYAVQVIGGAVLKVTVGGDQISVTAKDGVWCYDGEEHVLREWNIVNGDKLIAGHEFQIKIADESVITTPKDGELGDGIVSNRFEYVRIVDTATGADRTRNYNLFLYEGKLQVTNACVGVEMLDGIENVEKVYDGAATNVVVAADLLQPATVKYYGGRGVSVLPENPQWADEPLEFTDAGEYTVWYEVTADYYNTYTGKVEVTIAKRPVTLTSPTKAKPYDGAALTFDANEITIGGDGLVDGESFAFSGFASITDAGRVDAAFDYEAGANTSLENYAVTVVAGTLTVNASADEITVTAKSGVWKYDSLEHTLHDCDVVNGDVLQPGDELVVEYDAASRVTTPDDGEVENRIVSVKVMRGGAEGEDVTRNYSIAVYPGTLRVVNADVSFGSIDTSAFSTKAVYDGEGHTIAVTAPSLLTSPVTVTYAETAAGPWCADPMAVAVKNAGTHTIRYRVSAKYYNDYIGEATVVISPRKVTLLSASAKKVFDGTPLRVDEVSVKEGSLDFVDGEGVDAVCNSSQTGVGKIENGFSYEFRDGTLKDNYTIVPEFGWLEVTPGTLAVDVAASSYVGVYDGNAHGVTPKFTGTGLNLDACEITYARVAGDESAYAAEMPTFTDVGAYTVYVKIKAQNFEVVYTEMTVTITPRPVTVTVAGKMATYTYDSEEKTVSGYDISTEDELYDIAADTVFSGTESASRTDAGKSDMGLSAGNFANNNDCFEVTYQVTDGYVRIDPLDISAAAADEFAITLGANPKYNGTVQTIPVTSVTCGGLPVTYTLAGENATHAGVYTLTVKANGNFTGERSTTWQVLKRSVTLTSASAAKVYDGSPLINQNVTVGGDGFIGIEGAIFDVTGSQTVAGSSKNTFMYSLKAGTLSGDYDITKIEGELVVTKANVGGGTSGGEEPGAGEVPQGGVSKFDTSFVYDGEGHTIDTNALVAAFGNVIVGASVIEYAVDDGSVSGGVGHAALPWDATAPAYTNAGEYIVWYRVTNPNYNEFTHAAKVTITPRTGVVVDIVGNVATNVYSGAVQRVDGYAVAINDSLYKETDFEFAGNSAISGTAAGKYPMGLNASQFSNKNENFTDVTFNVTDGELVILGSLQKSIILDAMGGTFVDGTVVTQECEDVYIAFPVATREGHVFDGWYLGVTNGAPKATAGAGLLVDDDHTLFAKWKIDETLMSGGESIFTWEAIDANTAKITGIKNPGQKLSTLVFPDTINGKAVVEIADGAFANSRSGMTRILLPMYCVKIGYAAFTGVSTLTDILFSDVRSWQTPDLEATLAIGAYAFSGAGVSTVTLPATVSAIGDYAFANCAKLSNITILGQPTVGTKPLRRAGTSVGGVTVHLDPALASDNAYMNALKQECLNVTVRADAVVKRMKLSSLSMARNFIVLSVSVEKAAAWGKVDLSAIKVSYRKTLSDEPLMLTPSAIVENPDGSLSVEIPVPVGDSGFFQVVFQK